MMQLLKPSSSHRNDDITEETLPPLPIPVLQNIFEYLSQKDLKECRLVRRYWNSLIVCNQYIPGTVDYFIDINAFKVPSQAILETNTIDPRYMDLITRQHFYQENQILSEFSNASMKIIGFEILPDISKYITFPFYSTLDQVTSLELISTNLKLTQLLIQPRKFLNFLTLMDNLKKLKLSWEFIGLILYAETQTTNDVSKLTKSLGNIIELQISFTGDRKQFQRHSNAADFRQGFRVFQFLKKSLQRLSVKWPLVVKNEKLVDLLEARETMKNFFDMFEKHYLPSMLYLTHVDFEDATMPLKIFEDLNLVDGPVLKHLKLNLEGRLIQTQLFVTIHHLKSRNCSVELSLKLIYDNMADGFENKLHLSFPQSCQSLKKLTLHFTKNLFKNAQGLHVNFFMHFIPKYQPTGERVAYRNLTYLRIETEKPMIMIWLDFEKFASCFPNVLELVCIDGPEDLYDSSWEISKLKFTPNIFYGQMLISRNEIINIMLNFPKLKRLTLWSRMDISDRTFGIGHTSDDEPLVFEFGMYRLKKTFYNYLKNLEKFSIRGVTGLMTNKCLKTFHGLRYLEELEIIGSHQITKAGKAELLQKVPSLQKCRFKL